MESEIEKLIPILNALVYYSQISTVGNVRPVGMLRHEFAWREGQEWLWRNCDIVNGDYELKAAQSEPAVVDLGANEPWPLSDVLSKLIFASKYLLNEKSYDGHNYEEIQICVKMAEKYLEELTNAKTKAAQSKGGWTDEDLEYAFEAGMTYQASPNDSHDWENLLQLLKDFKTQEAIYKNYPNLNASKEEMDEMRKLK